MPTNFGKFRQLLANLWARGAALQCYFNQEDIDFVIPIYMGSIATDAVFDPLLLSVLTGQVKFKVTGATQAECDAVSPIGLLRDLHEPLPYLALLMDLGTEANYLYTNSKMQAIASGPLSYSKFAELTHKFDEDVKILRTCQSEKPKPKEAVLKELKKVVQNSRREMDHYNRYFVSVRGSSHHEYGILDEAQINGDFAMLLQVTAPVPGDQNRISQYMRPFERLGNESHQTASMMEYDKDAPMEGASGKAMERGQLVVMGGMSCEGIPDKVFTEGKTEDVDVDMDTL